MTAAECYARAIGHAPESAEAYECMGTLLGGELFEDHEQAEAAPRALTLAKSRTLALALTTDPDPEQAEAALRQAVAIDGARHVAWFELARLLKRAEARQCDAARPSPELYT